MSGPPGRRLPGELRAGGEQGAAGPPRPTTRQSHWRGWGGVRKSPVWSAPRPACARRGAAGLGGPAPADGVPCAPIAVAKMGGGLNLSSGSPPGPPAGVGEGWGVAGRRRRRHSGRTARVGGGAGRGRPASNDGAPITLARVGRGWNPPLCPPPGRPARGEEGRGVAGPRRR